MTALELRVIWAMWKFFSSKEHVNTNECIFTWFRKSYELWIHYGNDHAAPFYPDNP